MDISSYTGIMPYVKCKTCNKEFYAKPSWIKNGLGKYCSKNCTHKGLQKGEIKKCFICGVEVYKSRKALLGSKSNKFFCGKSCQTVWRNSILHVGPKHPNWKDGRYTHKNILAKSKTPKICLLCKNEDERVMAIHHIDGNHINNKLENLIWLCHNCHFLSHHHKKEKDELAKILEKRSKK